MVSSMARGASAPSWRLSIWSIAVFALAAVWMAVSAGTLEAKTPGKTYCFHGVCHRVLTIPEMVAIVGRDEVVEASHYDDCHHDRYNPCGLTSSGEAFYADRPDNAASPIYPDGTILLVRNPTNGRAAVVRVNNAGPYWRQRKLDVSRATAVKLGFAGQGVARLEVRVMTAPSIIDATYKRNRRYAPVPGALGSFASLDQAQGGMVMAIALNAMSTSVFAPVAGKMLTAMKTMEPALANVLRADPTRVRIASAGDKLPPSVADKLAKSVAVEQKPAVAVVSPHAVVKKAPTIALRSIRRPVTRLARVSKSRKYGRWAATTSRHQFKGTRSASSRSRNKVRFATASSSRKRSYWTSRASRNAAAISSRGPRAKRLATRKLSSIVRSDGARMAAASGAMSPRLRT